MIIKIYNIYKCAPASRRREEAVVSGQVKDVWEAGDRYEQYVGRWSRRLAPEFIAWLHLGPGLRWLDLGCGTGALSGAIWRGAAPARVFGLEPSRGFLRAARQNLNSTFAAARGLPGASPWRRGRWTWSYRGWC